MVQALADYRQGNWERAIATLRGDAGNVLVPAPQLILAMALDQSGQADEAREELSRCVFRHDWRYTNIGDQDGWIYHVLRRKAERLIMLDWNELASGARPPQDDNERILLMATRQFEERSYEVVRLYQAISPETLRAERPFFGLRRRAAAAAILAGTGHGADASDLPVAERAALRTQGRAWLQKDLTFWKEAHRANAQQAKPWIALTVGEWRNDLDLGRLRTPQSLASLPDGEKKEWEALWEEVKAVADLAGN